MQLVSVTFLKQTEAGLLCMTVGLGDIIILCLCANIFCVKNSLLIDVFLYYCNCIVSFELAYVHSSLNKVRVLLDAWLIDLGLCR